MAKDVRNVCKHTDIVFKHFIQRFKNEYLFMRLSCVVNVNLELLAIFSF